MDATRRRSAGGLTPAVWNRILDAFAGKEPAAKPETPEDFLARNPEVLDLLEGLGYDAPLRAEARALFAQLTSSIRVEIVDYAALHKSIAATIARANELPAAAVAFLNTLSSARDPESLTALLNADPVHDQIPFVEQIPVLRNGSVTWTSPARLSLVRKFPADRAVFLETLGRLEALFAEPHPARAEPVRVGVLDAVERLRKDIDRANAYLPTALLFLETRLDEYDAHSIRPRSAERIEALMSIIAGAVALSRRLERPQPGDREAIAAQAASYVARPKIHTPAVTKLLLTLLLHDAVIARTRRVYGASVRKLRMIRDEISTGTYNSAETAARLRRLEDQGYYFSSLVYALLGGPKNPQPAD